MTRRGFLTALAALVPGVALLRGNSPPENPYWKWRRENAHHFTRFRATRRAVVSYADATAPGVP